MSLASRRFIFTRSACPHALWVSLCCASAAAVGCSSDTGGDDATGAMVQTQPTGTMPGAASGSANPALTMAQGTGLPDTDPMPNQTPTQEPDVQGQDPEVGDPTTPSGGAPSMGEGGTPAVDVADGGAGGAPETGADGGTGGGDVANAGGTSGEEEPPDPVEGVDCGPNGVVIEDAGPASNRVNYVIIGDGYSEEELDTTYLEHIDFAMTKRFSDPIGQPYLRYRKFVNICAVQLPSQGDICGNSPLGCCGDDESRLANCDRGAATDAMEANFESVPDFDIDWTAVVLNGDSWWNTGAQLMLWSGGNQDAHGAALHEGGHGFHQLADEYGNCGGDRVNVTNDNQDSGDKWDLWLGHMQEPGTGLQDFFACDGGSNYRPTDNSMMNLLFGDDPDTSHNSVSREKMVMDFWRFVDPVDSVDPPEGMVTDTTVLRVNVIDPEVVNVDWSIDGQLTEEDGGAEFDVATMGSGTYEVTAYAYDNADEDLVRYRDGGDQYGRMNWERSMQTVSWTVSVP